MSYKPNENDLMAYLYGELEGSEKEAMEKYLFEHPDARRELERLQQMRSILSEVKDKEVIAPPIFFLKIKFLKFFSKNPIFLFLKPANFLILHLYTTFFSRKYKPSSSYL